MKLVVTIPALNEDRTIARVIRQIPTTLDRICEVEVVVIDDGSTDQTRTEALAAGAAVVSHNVNLGVGLAFQTATREALKRGADILVTIDGDGQFNPLDIEKLIQPIVHGSAQMVTASRFSDKNLTPEMPWVKKWGNRRVARIVSRLSGIEMHDVSCGFRAYSREALLRLTVHHTFTYTHETLLDLAAKHVTIHEVPLVVRGVREFGKSRVASNVFKYGCRTSLIMMRFFRDYHPLALCLYLSLPFHLLGVLLLFYSWLHWLGTAIWLKWAAFSGAFSISIGLGIFFFGFMADITSRLRRNQEEMLYWQRRAATSGSQRALDLDSEQKQSIQKD